MPADTGVAGTDVSGTTNGAERPVIVLLHGYGMQPETYIPMAQRLTDRADVVIPGLWNVPGWWTFDRAVDCLECTLDDAGIGRVSLIADSFGGALLLGFVARRPDRVVECVFGDTLGVNREVAPGRRGSPPVRDPAHGDAGGRVRVRAFVDDAAGVTRHRGTVRLRRRPRSRHRDRRQRGAAVPRAVGRHRHRLVARRRPRFADRLHADFTVARRPPGYGPIDHDWMFDDPVLFADHLRELGLQALS